MEELGGDLGVAPRELIEPRERGLGRETLTGTPRSKSVHLELTTPTSWAGAGS